MWRPKWVAATEDRVNELPTATGPLKTHVCARAAAVPDAVRHDDVVRILEAAARMHDQSAPASDGDAPVLPYEQRLRVPDEARTPEELVAAGDEATALYCDAFRAYIQGDGDAACESHLDAAATLYANAIARGMQGAVLMRAHRGMGTVLHELYLFNRFVRRCDPHAQRAAPADEDDDLG